MLFPNHTLVNKDMPITKFMRLAKLSPISKNEIKNNVERMVISHVLNESTINISKGKNVCEITVFEFFLKEKELSERIIREIDSIIPKNIIYVLRNGDKAQLVVSYKEKLLNSDKYKVISVYKTDWKNYEDFKLDINGLNLDIVFNNFVSFIAGGKINIEDNSNIKDTVEKSVEIEKLLKKLKQIEKKISVEKQFNKLIPMKKEWTIIKEKLIEKGYIWNE